MEVIISKIASLEKQLRETEAVLYRQQGALTVLKEILATLEKEALNEN